jgi:hypothetical protein
MLSAALLLASALPAGAEAPAPPRQVYLNAQGVMEALRTSNPGHYREILDRLAASADPTPGFLLATYPPQRNVDIVIGATHYRARLTLPGGGETVIRIHR